MLKYTAWDLEGCDCNFQKKKKLLSNYSENDTNYVQIYKGHESN